jgi:hypothetical protein
MPFQDVRIDKSGQLPAGLLTVFVVEIKMNPTIDAALSGLGSSLAKAAE